jgi:erythromycin esterase
MNRSVALVALCLVSILSSFGQSVRTDIFRTSGMDDLNDLSYLKTVLKNKQVVLLGESSHGIGEFYSLKSRIVKYLHEEMGYEVLFMESGLGDVYFQYRGIDSVSAQELRNRTVYGNFQCKEMMPLFEYIKSTQPSSFPPDEKSLKYAGFDSQNYSYSIDVFRKIIDKYVPGSSKELLADVLKYYEIPKYLWSGDSAPLFAYSDTIMRASDELLKILKEHEQDIQKDFGFDETGIAILQRTAVNYHEAVDLNWDVDNPMARRDSLMAENLFWMMENIYPNKKTIIWGHNLHIDKSSAKEDNIKWMGHFVAKRFGKKAYHLGLFAREGESFEWWTKKNISFKNDSINNVEFLINPTSEVTVFMDFTKIKPKKRPAWLGQYALGFEVENGRELEFIPLRRFDGIIVVGKAHVPTY